MFLIYLIFFIHGAMADQAVLLQSAEVLEDDYLAYLVAHHELKSPIEVLQKYPRSHSKELLDNYGDAQEAFLAGRIKEAQDGFKSVTDLSLSDEWNEAERRVILHAFLRRAQLENDIEIQNQIIKEAANIDPTVSPNSALFPPPIVKALNETKKSLETIDVRKLTNSDRPVLLINGRVCTREACTKILANPTMKVRLTWLSNKWQPATKVVSLSSAQIPLEKAAWTDNACRESYQGLLCQTFHSKSQKIDFKPRPIRPQDIATFRTTSTKRPVWKSPWLWAGVGLAVALVVANEQKKSNDKESSTTYGY